MRVENDWIAAKNSLAATEPDSATNQPTRDDRDKIRPTSLPHHEREGRGAIRAGIREAETKGLSGSTLLAALMS